MEAALSKLEGGGICEACAPVLVPSPEGSSSLALREIPQLSIAASGPNPRVFLPLPR